jgi:cell division protein FtsB
MTEGPTAPRGPRPVAAFLWSLALSAFVLAMLLVTDPRLLQLKKGRAEVRELDRKIAQIARENEELRASLDAASRQEFPAEKTAREDLSLVRSDELVLLYPRGSLTRQPSAARGNLVVSATPTPRR